MNLDDRHFLKQLGERLRARPLDRKLTQAQLGEACDLHRTFVGSVERGERNVSLLNLRTLAKALRISLSDLLAEAR